MSKLTDNLSQTPASIYDERLDKAYNYTPETGHRTVAVSKPSVPPPVFTEEELDEPETIREWSCPLVAREKLADTLNLLEKDGNTIFQVLPMTATQVQIITYREVEKR